MIPENKTEKTDKESKKGDKNMDKGMTDAVHEMYMQGMELKEEGERLIEIACDLNSYERLHQGQQLVADGELLMQSARIIRGE